VAVTSTRVSALPARQCWIFALSCTSTSEEAGTPSPRALGNCVASTL
jgi:hypothetical protein